jgi:hypothetical protein
MLRKTLSEGFFCFSAVVRDQRSKSPGVISTISYELEMRANAKFMCVNVSAAICSGVYDLHDLRKCVRTNEIVSVGQTADLLLAQPS